MTTVRLAVAKTGMLGMDETSLTGVVDTVNPSRAMPSSLPTGTKLRLL
jgi:hypothetical protein